jgi:hypothetical protein
MKTPDKLYEAAIDRISQAIAIRRAEPDCCAIEGGDFVIDHDTALALAAAQAIGLRELFAALCDARATLARQDGVNRQRRAA